MRIPCISPSTRALSTSSIAAGRSSPCSKKEKSERVGTPRTRKGIPETTRVRNASSHSRQKPDALLFCSGAKVGPRWRYELGEWLAQSELTRDICSESRQRLGPRSPRSGSQRHRSCRGITTSRRHGGLHDKRSEDDELSARRKFDRSRSNARGRARRKGVYYC